MFCLPTISYLLSFLYIVRETFHAEDVRQNISDSKIFVVSTTSEGGQSFKAWENLRLAITILCPLKQISVRACRPEFFTPFVLVQEVERTESCSFNVHLAVQDFVPLVNILAKERRCSSIKSGELPFRGVPIVTKACIKIGHVRVPVVRHILLLVARRMSFVNRDYDLWFQQVQE